MRHGVLFGLVLAALGSWWWLHAPQVEGAGVAPRGSVEVASAEPEEAAPVRAARLAPAVAPHDAAPAPLGARGVGEWRGMPVDMEHRSACASSAHCSESTACWEDGQCGPCRADADCLGSEVCVLEHCVDSAAAGCRSARDCADDALCVLERTDAPSARPGGPALAAICRSRTGGVPDEQAPPARAAPEPDAPRVVGVRPEDLLEVVRAGVEHR